MDDHELESVVRLERRLDVPFVFCAREGCESLIRRTVSAISKHLRKPECRRDEFEIMQVILALQEKGAMEIQPRSNTRWLHEIILSEPIQPFPMLPTAEGSFFGCGDCAHAEKSSKKIRVHYDREHPGRQVNFRRCVVQILKVRGHSRYVQVTGVVAADETRAACQGLSRQPEADAGSNNVVTPVSVNMEPNYWLERMGFAAHFEGYKLDFVAGLVELDGTAQLGSIADHLEKVCFKAARRLAAEAASNDALLMQLNRRTSSDATLQTFNWDIRPETVSKYAKSWHYVIAYVERIYRWDSAEEPPCKLTELQRAAFSNAASLDWAAASEEDRDAVVFDLVWHISNHPLRRSTFESVLVSASAALAVDPRKNCWRTGLSYDSTHFSGIIKVLLFIIYMRAVSAVDDQARNRAVPSWTKMQTEIPRFKDDLDAITQAMDGVVYVGKEKSYSTPVTWTTRAQVIAKSNRMEIARPPMVEWEPEGQLRLIAKGEITSRRTMSKLMLLAMHDASEALSELLLSRPNPGSRGGPLDAPVPELSEVRDERTKLAVGYSFLENASNLDWVSDAAAHLESKIIADAGLRGEWYIKDRVRPAAAKSYETKRKQFLSKLAVAIHVTAGQPSRRTEQRILRWRNSLQGGLRNVVVCRGRVGIRSVWYKRRWTAKHEVAIWRFLPPLVSRLMVIYISTVLPFWRYLRLSAGEEGDLPCFLYAVGPLQPKEGETKLMSEDRLLSNPFKELCRRGLGYPLTIAQYRHVAIAYARRFMHNQSLDTILGLESGGADDESLGAHNGGGRLAEVTDAQAAHSTMIADMVYAVEYDAGEKFNKFLEASLHWHVLFHLYPERLGSNVQGGADVMAQLEERVARLSLLPDLASEASLEVMLYGGEARPRQHQLMLVRAVEEHARVVYVTGDTISESAGSNLPAFVRPGGCTVFILPTRAWQQKAHARLSAQGIKAALWDSRGANPPAPIVMITPNEVRMPEWRRFVLRQQTCRSIDRVVLDGAHEVLLARREWHSELLDIAAEMDAICPRQVFLASILPPTLQDVFLSRLKLGGEGGAPYILRTKTTRDNIRFEYVNASEVASVAEAVREMTRKATREGHHAIIFGDTRETCDVISASLDIPKYYNEMSTVDQQRSLAKWRGEPGVLSATARFTDEIDYGGVSLVVCLGTFSYLELCEQFERTGRDGKLALVVLMARLSELSDEVRTFATSRCKREAISLYLDGKPEPCGFRHNACSSCKYHCDVMGNI